MPHARKGLEPPPGEHAATRTSTAARLATRSRRRVVWPGRNSMAACYRVPPNGSVGAPGPVCAAATLGPMKAWQLSAVEEAQARRSTLSRVPSRPRPVGRALRPRGRRTEPQSPHSEDELYFVVTGRGRVTVGRRTGQSRPGHSCSSPRTSPTASMTSPSDWSSSSCSDRPRATAPDRAETTIRRPLSGVRSSAAASSAASSGPRPASSWRKNANTSSPAARKGSSRAAQAAISSAVVVVSSEAQVQERPGPPHERRLCVLGQLGRAKGGAGSDERLERLVDVHDGSWNSIVSG